MGLVWVPEAPGLPGEGPARRECAALVPVRWCLAQHSVCRPACPRLLRIARAAAGRSGDSMTSGGFAGCFGDVYMNVPEQGRGCLFLMLSLILTVEFWFAFNTTFTDTPK